MAIVDARHLHDLSVSWLITREAADDFHHHYNNIKPPGPDCTRLQGEVGRQRRWPLCRASSS